MNKRKLIGIFLLIFIMTAVTGCSKSPEEKRKDFLASAQKFQSEGKHAEAAIQYQNALKIAPDDVNASINLGELRLKLNQPQEAFTAFSRASQADPKNVKSREYLASMLLLAKKYDMAEKHAAAILEQDPNNILAKEVKAQTLFISGKRDQAIAIMEDLLKGPKPSEDMFINTAQMYMVTGRTEDALALAMKGASLFPKSPRIRLLVSDMYAYKKDTANAKKWVEEAYKASGNDVSTGVALAMFYSRHNMEDLYRAQLDDLKKRFPENPEPYLLESSILHQKKDLEGSLKTAQKALELKDSTQTRTVIAQLLIEKKDIAQAKKMLTETVEKDQQATHPRILLARVYLEEKNNDKALELLEMPLKVASRNPDVASTAAQAYLMKGDLKKAREVAEPALEENKQNIMLHRIMAKIHFTQNEYKKAIAETDLLVKNSIKSPDILYIGAISSLKTGNIQAADAYIQSLKAVVPNDWITYHSNILLLMAKKDLNGAYRTVDKAVELFPDNEDGLILYTYIAPKVAGWQAAIAKISGICSKKDTAACHMTLSFLYEGAGNNSNALQEIKKAIALEPDKTMLYHALAQYYARHNMMKDALDEYQKILNKKPDDLAAATMLALLYQGSGDNGAAKKVYRYILEKNPKDARAANNLAWLLAEENNKKDLDEALMLAQKAKDAFPEDPRIADTLGYVYLRKGLADNALGQFQMAVEKLPNEPTILYHQALAFVDLKRPKDAAQALTKSLASSQNFKEKQEAQALLSKIQSAKMQ
jgi:tetratricopeptide (TPR) repeat protein